MGNRGSSPSFYLVGGSYRYYQYAWYSLRGVRLEGSYGLRVRTCDGGKGYEQDKNLDSPLRTTRLVRMSSCYLVHATAMDLIAPTGSVANTTGRCPTTTNNRRSTVDEEDEQEVIEAQVSFRDNSLRPATSTNRTTSHSNARSTRS